MGTNSLSSSRVLPTIGFFGLLAGWVIALCYGQPSESATGFSCPNSIQLTEAPITSMPWHPESATTSHRFLRPSLYNGTAGKAEYELAPDSTQVQGSRITESWKLSDYRDMNLFVRCHYAGTSATLFRDLPKKLTFCSFSFTQLKPQQPPGSPVFDCR
jgi:hypothetical protein